MMLPWLPVAGVPLLTLSVVLPIAFAALVLAAPERFARPLAWLGVLAHAVVTVWSVLAFNPARTGLQLVEIVAWMPQIGASWHLGVDGISAPFLPLTTLLTAVLVLHADNPFLDRQRPYLAAVLSMAGILSGLFAAADLVVFFVFWELSLVPVHVLTSAWGGGPERRYAAARYTITMLTGGVPLLLGFALIATHTGSVQTDLVMLAQHPFTGTFGMVVGGLVLLGLAFKTPIVPLHAWLALLLTEGPAGVAAWMVGMKLGAYGILRLVVPMFPGLVREHSVLLGLLGLVGVLHGAGVALEQRGLRRLVAFTSTSHVGLVVMGIASGTVEGMQGAVLQLYAFALISPLLVLLSGSLFDRLGTTDLDALGGLGTALPRWTTLLILSVAAGIGFPGTLAFVAEQTLLVGVFRGHVGLGALATVGLVVGVAALVGWTTKAAGGPVTRPAVAQASDLSPREVGVLMPLLVATLLLGLFPAPLLAFTAPAVGSLVEGVRAAAPVAVTPR